MDNPEIDPYTYDQPIFDKGEKNNSMEERLGKEFLDLTIKNILIKKNDKLDFIKMKTMLCDSHH